MEMPKYCAYNQTREYFLGLEITSGDFSCQALSKKGTLAADSNKGLWLTPFRGLPDVEVLNPLDLIYLDSDCRVLHLVESFPQNRISPSKRSAESVLVVPAHSILLSETEVGDQLVLCVGDQMQRRLEWLSSKESEIGTTTGSVCQRDKSSEASARVLSGVEGCSVDRCSAPEPVHAELHISLVKRAIARPKSWLLKLFSTDPRKADRHEARGLSAYFWDGGPPRPHKIRDISSSGLFLVTDERWYQGTMVLMTLQDNNPSDKRLDHAIAVKLRTARWGNDGVGLQFIEPDERDSTSNELVVVADRKQLGQFLTGIRERK